MKKINLTHVSLIDMFHLRQSVVLSVHAVAASDDMLALCAIRSWTGQETTTQTSSRRPTLAFVKPSSQTHRRTRLCLPEHSRTKPSTCTGSRKNAGRAARVHQRAARRTSNGRNWRRREDICHFWVFLGLRSAQQPAVILLIISEHRLLWSASRLHLEAALCWLTESGSRYQTSKQHPAEEMSFSPANGFCFLAISVSVLLTKTPSLGSDWWSVPLHSYFKQWA